MKDNITRLYTFKLLKSMYFFSGVLIPFFTVWGGITFFQVMIIQSWFVLWQTALEVPTGVIADRWGRKASIVLGILVNIGAVILYSIRPDFLIFLAAEFLWALSSALISGADVAILYDTLKEDGKEGEAKKVIGRFTSFELIGIVIAAPVGSFIGARFGLQYAVLAMAVPFLIAAFFALSLVEPKYKSENMQPHYIEVFRKGVKEFIRSKALTVLAFDAISISVMSFFIIWTYQPLLTGLGLPVIYLGAIHSVAALLEIIVLNSSHAIDKRIGKRRYFFLTALLIGISYVLLSISSSIVFSVMLILVIFGFGLTRKALFTGYMNKHIASENRATVNSVISMIETLGRGIIYPIYGIIAGLSLNLAVLILGVLALAFGVTSKVEESLLE